jgi:F-type H+-transporting ATPase subunit epsilon
MPVQLEIVSPARLLLSRAVDMVVLPGYEGDLAAMANHAPMITLLRGGVIALYDNDAVTDQFFVGGGFAEITADRCTILADDVILVAELSVADAQARLAAASKAWDAVDKLEIDAREAAMDALLSAREAVRVAQQG